MFQTTKQDKWKNSTKNSHPLRPIIIIIRQQQQHNHCHYGCRLWDLGNPHPKTRAFRLGHSSPPGQNARLLSKFWTWNTRKTRDSDWDCSILNNGDNHCFYGFAYVQAYLFILLLVSTSCFLEDEGLPPQFLEMTQLYMVNPSPTLHSLLKQFSPN